MRDKVWEQRMLQRSGAARGSARLDVLPVAVAWHQEPVFVAVPRPQSPGPVLGHMAYRVVLPIRLANPLTRRPHRAGVAIEDVTESLRVIGIGDVWGRVPEYRLDN